MRLLLLEDDEPLREAYSRALRSDGHAVDEAETIAHARAALSEVDYDCAVLDRLVSDGDSIGIVNDLSGVATRPSLLMLSGLGDGDNRMLGLETGADDYVAKPVSLTELVVRVRKLIVRRTAGPAKVQIGRVLVDRTRRHVTVDGEEVRLSPTQYAVFEQLVIHFDRVVDFNKLLERCWDADRDLFSNPLHSQITRLRSTFKGVLTIDSARGSGYILRVHDES